MASATRVASQGLLDPLPRVAQEGYMAELPHKSKDEARLSVAVSDGNLSAWCVRWCVDESGGCVDK